MAQGGNGGGPAKGVNKILGNWKDNILTGTDGIDVAVLAEHCHLGALARLPDLDRAYRVLEELNTDPSVVYLKKVDANAS